MTYITDSVITPKVEADIAILKTSLPPADPRGTTLYNIANWFVELSWWIGEALTENKIASAPVERIIS